MAAATAAALIIPQRSMINAERIALALDSRLSHSVSLIIYGRAALALGFDSAPANVNLSLDVDAIIPVSQAASLREDQNFWDAVEGANLELANDGLYITHLFTSDQVFLRRDWEKHLVPVTRPVTNRLRLFRPATLDLILTKMMRGDDPEDLADIEFLLRHEHITLSQLESAFQEAVIPELHELREAYERAKPRVRQLASGSG